MHIPPPLGILINTAYHMPSKSIIYMPLVFISEDGVDTMLQIFAKSSKTNILVPYNVSIWLIIL